MTHNALPADAPPPASAAEVERLTRELAQVRAEFQDFVHTVSHDLRAPLRHISAYTKIIEEDLPNPPPDIVGHLATIRQAAQLLASQLDGLAQLSRIEALRLHLQPVDASALAQSVIAELTQKYPSLVVQCHLAQDIPKVWVDADVLRQVFTHLLDNAFKFSQGRVPAQVTLSWAPAPEAPGQCQISITDNGVGFPPEQAGKLFKVFARLHPVRDFAGLGLGLVVARKLVERLGGRIDITAQANAGCRVTVTLASA